ncbi:hypothetical protein [Pseudonocardia xishanensis]|uniref:hypothetical protein n=1 Tax=Pseudonocardia xishanensis TaxID=630995 RepID=UPI0031EB19A0
MPSERRDSADGTAAAEAPGAAERIDAAADELYGVPPDDFVPVRDELVAEAREAGDKDAAKAIGRLRRPTQAAWLSNLLARERGDQLDTLLDLADSLSTAQRSLDGPQLRQLSAQRSKLVGAMAKEARRIAAADGHRVTETVERDLRGILDAALADPDIADEVRSGRLTRTISWSGFGPDSGEASSGGWGTPRDPAAPREPRERRAPRTPRRPAPGRPGHGLPGVEPRHRGRRPGLGDGDDRPGEAVDESGTQPAAEPAAAESAAAESADGGSAAERERAERERREREERERREREAARAEAREAVEQARRAAGRAADAHEDTAAALRDAESDRDEATALVERLTAELERAREARAAATATVKDAAQAEREASRASRDAAAGLARAEARLAELDD